MDTENNPDIYLCALMAQMIKAREGDIKREFQALVDALTRLRGYDDKTVLTLVHAALQLDTDNDFDALVAICKNALSDDLLREAIGLLAFVARLDGDVSPEEEEVFARICVGVGLTINKGKVEISR